MRYVLFVVLSLAACTRANPDAVGGNGGGGGAAGGGGTGGGGGTVGGADLSMPAPHDMAVVPGDMTSFVGVFCGSKVCMAPDNECCATSSSLTCQSPAMQCNGSAYDCDGPEDCLPTETCCGGGTGSTCDPLGGGGCQNGRVPLCHTLVDCPKTNGGFVACCSSPQGGHLRFCSTKPCP